METQAGWLGLLAHLVAQWPLALGCPHVELKAGHATYQLLVLSLPPARLAWGALSCIQVRVLEGQGGPGLWGLGCPGSWPAGHCTLEAAGSARWLLRFPGMVPGVGDSSWEALQLLPKWWVCWFWVCWSHAEKTELAVESLTLNPE